MRLALVTHNVVRNDGQGRMNFELARHCLAEGVRVRLYASRVEPELLDAGAEWVRVSPPVKRPALAEVMGFVRRADRAVRADAGELDVVVANGYSLRVPHDVNIANFVHSSYLRVGLPLETGRGVAWRAYQRAFTTLNAAWERGAFAAAGRVVAISGEVRRELLAIGVPEAKIRTIPYGVDLQEFRPPAADRSDGAAARRTLGLPEGVPLLLFAGDIRTARKNLATVLAALPSLPGVHLAVVGAVGGSPSPAEAERLGLSGRVHFLGFRRDVAAVMRACDLFVFPTRYEPFGLVILEALASGLPVVTSAVAGAAELLTPACGVALADPEDAAALAAALRRLLADPAALNRMRRAARGVAERHRWGSMAGQYLALFNSTAARPDSAGRRLAEVPHPVGRG